MTLPLARRNYTDRLYFDPLTIKSGTDTTQVGIDLGNHTLNGVLVPDGMDGTSLAVLGSINGTDYFPLKNIDGNPVQIVIDSTATMYVLSPLDTSCVRYVKFKSDSTESADRVLTCIGIRISEESKQ